MFDRLKSAEHAGEADVVPNILYKHALKHMGEQEHVEFFLLGTNGQGIVALEDRLLVIKPGWEAGAWFGARVTSFFYADITGIEVNTGIIMGVIEINTPAYQGTVGKDYWSLNRDRDPRLLTNCIPIPKKDVQLFQPYLDRIRQKIRHAKHGPAHSGPANGDDPASLAGELEKLAALRDSGVLTEEEFLRAKEGLLTG